MRKLLLLCAMAVPLVAFAESVKLNKEVICNDASVVFPALDQFNEQPMFSGTLSASTIVFMVNVETQSWTILQTDGNVACVIDVGEGFKFQIPELKSENMVLK